MSHAIYYTSAPEGIKRGTTGFCTVAATDNIPKPLWDRLETLSAYRHQFAAGAGGDQPNPVSFAHWILNIAGKTHHVLSRVCDSGVDHTQRTNAFAHHLVLDRAEIEAAPGGPAWMLQQPGVMAHAWDGRVGSMHPMHLPIGDAVASLVCHAWAAATGDAGWGGHLADLFAKAPTRPVCILFAPGQNVLPLVAEAIALLPPAARWNVTFNTYFTSMPTSATCLWRCCLAGTPAAQTGLRYAAGGLVLDLTDRSRLPALPPGPYVTVARTGQPAFTESATAKTPAPPRAEPRKSAAGPQPPQRPKTASERLSEELDRRDQERDRLLGDFDKLLDDGTSLPPAAPNIDFADADSSYELRAEDTPATSVPEGRQQNALASGGRPASARTFRRAEEALAAAEREAGLAAAHRRRQVLLLFVGALLAIGVGSGLVYLSLRRGAPPAIPATISTFHPRPIETNPSLPVPETLPTTVVATQEPATTTATVAQTRPPETATQAAAPPIVYPDVLTFATALEKPNVGTGIGDWPQFLAFRMADLDPLPVTGMRLVLFPGQPDKLPNAALPAPNGVVSYRNSTLGTLSAVPNLSRNSFALYWRPASDPGLGTELASAAFDRAKHGVDIQWHRSALLRNPTVFNTVFWVLQNSALELDSPRATKQRLAMKPLTLPSVDFTDPAFAAFDLPWPVELPRDVRAVEPAQNTLPTGWKADWYPDWDPKLAPASRTPDNSWQVISFKKSTGHPKVDAWFLLTFKPGAGAGPASAENTFARRLAQDQADLAKVQTDLADVNKRITDITNDPALKTFGGTVPAELFAKQADAKLAVDAYKAALSGYNELDGFDVSFELSDGVRLATFRFQRPKAGDTGK
jgi:hypothetical protein